MAAGSGGDDAVEIEVEEVHAFPARVFSLRPLQGAAATRVGYEPVRDPAAALAQAGTELAHVAQRVVDDVHAKAKNGDPSSDSLALASDLLAKYGHGQQKQQQQQHQQQQQQVADEVAGMDEERRQKRVKAVEFMHKALAEINHGINLAELTAAGSFIALRARHVTPEQEAIHSYALRATQAQLLEEDDEQDGNDAESDRQGSEVVKPGTRKRGRGDSGSASVNASASVADEDKGCQQLLTAQLRDVLGYRGKVLESATAILDRHRERAMRVTRDRRAFGHALRSLGRQWGFLAPTTGGAGVAAGQPLSCADVIMVDCSLQSAGSYQATRFDAVPLQIAPNGKGACLSDGVTWTDEAARRTVVLRVHDAAQKISAESFLWTLHASAHEQRAGRAFASGDPDAGAEDDSDDNLERVLRLDHELYRVQHHVLSLQLFQVMAEEVTALKASADRSHAGPQDAARSSGAAGEAEDECEDAGALAGAGAGAAWYGSIVVRDQSSSAFCIALSPSASITCQLVVQPGDGDNDKHEDGASDHSGASWLSDCVLLRCERQMLAQMKAQHRNHPPKQAGVGRDILSPLFCPRPDKLARHAATKTAGYWRDNPKRSVLQNAVVHAKRLLEQKRRSAAKSFSDASSVS